MCEKDGADTMKRHSCRFGVAVQNVLVIPLKPSICLVMIVVIAHGAGVAAVWVSGLSLTMHVALKLGLLGSLLWSLARLGWGLSRWRAVELRFFPAVKDETWDRIEWLYADGRQEAGRLVEGGVVLPALITLPFQPDGARSWMPLRAIPLLPDSAAPDDLRQLRVRLRWGRAAPV